MLATIRTTLSLAVPLAVLCLQTSCTQPTVNCTSAHGTFAARFDLEKGDKDQPCGQLTTDILGMQTYYAEGGVNGTPKFADAKVAFRAKYLYAYTYARLLAEFAADDVDPVTNMKIPGKAMSKADDLKLLDEMVGDPDVEGKFGSPDPDAEGFCQVPKVNKVTLDLPDIAEIPDNPETEEADGSPAQAAAKLVYEWDDIRFLVTPDAQGTQFEATLKFTQDECQATYRVRAVYPVYNCVEDEDCHDETSPLNPDFKLKCIDALCVLDADLPAYE